MKKIINGKIYDTNTAKELGDYYNGYAKNDFNYICETLYRKKTGEFFVLGEGGANTKYCSRTGDSWSAGAAIIPISYENAREWAEEHLGAEEYQEIFGEITEDESRVSLNLSISASTAEKLKRAASQNGMTVSAFIEAKLSDI